MDMGNGTNGVGPLADVAISACEKGDGGNGKEASDGKETWDEWDFSKHEWEMELAEAGGASQGVRFNNGGGDGGAHSSPAGAAFGKASGGGDRRASPQHEDKQGDISDHSAEKLEDGDEDGAIGGCDADCLCDVCMFDVGAGAVAFVPNSLEPRVFAHCSFDTCSFDSVCAELDDALGKTGDAAINGKNGTGQCAGQSSTLVGVAGRGQDGNDDGGISDECSACDYVLISACGHQRLGHGSVHSRGSGKFKQMEATNGGPINNANGTARRWWEGPISRNASRGRWTICI
jgi:hypothetical protein